NPPVHSRRLTQGRLSNPPPHSAVRPEPFDLARGRDRRSDKLSTAQLFATPPNDSFERSSPMSGILPDFIPTGSEAFDPRCFAPRPAWLPGAGHIGFPASPWTSVRASLPAADAGASSAPAAAPAASAPPPSSQPPGGFSLPVPAHPLAGLGDVL